MPHRAPGSPIGEPGGLLVVLRGNSGSGKTTVARAVRAALRPGEVAVVSQDVVRRDVLGVHDEPGNPTPGLLDVVTRYALAHAPVVVVEGILDAARYGDLLRGLRDDHRGCTRAYVWDLTFDETVARHRTRAGASFGEAQLRRWWHGLQRVDDLHEETLGADRSVADVVRQIVAARPQGQARPGPEPPLSASGRPPARRTPR